MEASLEAKEETIRNLQEELKEVKASTRVQESKDTTRARRGRPPATEEQEELQ
jgi:hypothetical protein